tara:strand:- start:2663 stop:3136 length:474 start_codon:yes stop_codon:yes gene_type:complete
MRANEAELKKVLGNLTKAYEQGFWAAIELTKSSVEIEEVLHKPTIEEKVEKEKPTEWPKGRYPENYIRHDRMKMYSRREKLEIVKAVNARQLELAEKGIRATLVEVCQELNIPSANYSRWKKQIKLGTLRGSRPLKGTASWHLANLAKVKEQRSKNK